MQKSDLSERDICTKFITPAILGAGWGQSFLREEVQLTDGRVIVRGQLAARLKDPDVSGGPKRADYILYAFQNVSLAVIEAKRNIFPLVTNLGRWGNGDVEVALSSLDELPYAIGLVRQAFEKQMGSGSES
jgi:hypothetical protein